MNYLTGLIIAIYLRKSRSDIEEEKKALACGEVYDTLQRHRKELLTFARKNKLKIADIFEEVVSGDSIEARPKVQDLLTNVEKGKYQGVLVIAYDRLGRGDKTDQGIIEKTFKDSDTLIITPKHTIDLNDEQGEMQADFEGFISRMEYRKIKGRLRDGLNRAVLEGKNMGTTPPFGYTKDKDHVLQIIPEEAKIIEMIFAKAIEGYGSHTICTHLHNLGIRTRNGNAFIPKAIRDIIRNPKYKGDQFYGRKSKNPIYVEDCHTPIIDKETWKIANDRINQRAPIDNEDAPMQNPLSTILVCSNCKNTLRRVKSHAKGNVYTYYYCKTSWCDMKGAKSEEVIDALLNELRELLHSIEVESSDLIISDDLELLEKKLHTLQGELEDIEERRDTIHELLENKTYTQEMFLDRMNKANEQEQRILSDIQDTKKAIIVEKTKNDHAKHLAPAITNVLSIYKDCTPEQQNRLFKSFIEKIIYTKKNKGDDVLLEVISQK